MKGQQATFYPVVGGLDEATQAIAVSKGRVIACQNHESVFQGYGRVGGYERFSGQPSPTDVYVAAGGEDGSLAITVPLREAARTAITKVPGTGPVRGVWTFNNTVYAWRDNVGQTKGIMYKSSATGWQEVNLGHRLPFTTGGTTAILPGNTVVGGTAGASAVVRKVVMTSGSWAAGSAAGYLILDFPTGEFRDERLKIGGVEVATSAAVSLPQTFPAGGRYNFTTHNFYASPALRCFYGANGVGRGFEVDASGIVTLIYTQTSAALDVPTDVAVFKDHLFFGFGSGSLVHSQPGEPLLWDGAMGAVELGVGSPVTGLSHAPGGALFAFCETQVMALFGSNVDDWTLEVVTDEGGGYRYTMQRVTEIIYMDNVGVRTTTTARDSANYRVAATGVATITNSIAKTLERKKKFGVLPTASVVCKDKSQYRLFFSDGSGVTIFFGRKYPECMTFLWPTSAFCTCTTKDELGPERMYVGSADGYVYRMDMGTSFDGASIEAFIQFPFDHEGAALTLKKWHKVTFEMVASPNTQISISAEFDYSGVDQPGLGLTALMVSGGGGGIWSGADWSDFYWSSPVAGIAENWIDGQGLNMSIIMVSTSAEQWPYIVQGVHKSFTVRGTQR